MPIITAQEINAIAFTDPIDLALMNDEVINTAETVNLIPVITQSLYADISMNPGNYSILITEYIKPYLSFCIKFQLYSQYFPGSISDSRPDRQREEILNEIRLIIQAKKNLLVKQLASGLYPKYAPPFKRRVNGFLIR